MPCLGRATDPNISPQLQELNPSTTAPALSVACDWPGRGTFCTRHFLSFAVWGPPLGLRRAKEALSHWRPLPAPQGTSNLLSGRRKPGRKGLRGLPALLYFCPLRTHTLRTTGAAGQHGSLHWLLTHFLAPDEEESWPQQPCALPRQSRHLCCHLHCGGRRRTRQQRQRADTEMDLQIRDWWKTQSLLRVLRDCSIISRSY